MTSRISSVWILALLAGAIATAEPSNDGLHRGHPAIEKTSGHKCKGGAHTQPEGPFGVYVFCDDAVGTNIAVLYQELGEPRYGKWTLTRRFWQDGPWAADVSAFGWVPGRNLLVVATSEIYGSGAVYLLNLESQTFVSLGSTKDCGSTILALTDTSVTLGLNNCEVPQPFKKITFKFPPT
jgi:hypothetical protein